MDDCVELVKPITDGTVWNGRNANDLVRRKFGLWSATLTMFLSLYMQYSLVFLLMGGRIVRFMRNSSFNTSIVDTA